MFYIHHSGKIPEIFTDSPQNFIKFLVLIVSNFIFSRFLLLFYALLLYVYIFLFTVSGRLVFSDK